MEIKNGVGFKDGLAYIRSPKRDLENNRAVIVISLSTGDLFTLWERDNSPHVTKFLNLVEPKQLPNEAGSVIRNVRTERHIYNEAVLAANGEWRVASKDSRERKLGAIFSQAIIEWEEV